MLIGKVAKCILVACLFSILSGGIFSILLPSVSAFPWGKIDAQVDYDGIYYLSRYDSGNVNLSVSYIPYYIVAYFPIWVEINVIEHPLWLTVAPSESTFALQVEASQTIPIGLGVNVNARHVTSGVIGRVTLEITGKLLLGPKLFREIDPAKVYIQVGYTPLTVNITFPLYGAVLENTVVIKGTVSAGDEGRMIERVEIKIEDGDWEVATGTTSWSYSWDTTRVENGEYTIQARGKYGNEYTSIDSTSVIVKNKKSPGFEMILVVLGIVSMLVLKKKIKRYKC